MKISLFLSHNAREINIRKALVRGFAEHGDTCEWVPHDHYDGRETDLAVFVGVKRKSLFEDCAKAGIKTLMLDKGYFHSREYYRVSLGGYQPPYFNEMKKTPERLDQMGIVLRPYCGGLGRYVIFAGSSHKYCAFHNLGDVNDYALNVCAKLNEILQGKKEVVYRPKPSWWANPKSNEKRIGPEKSKLPPNTKFSSPVELLSYLLPETACLVTHGSNSAVEALISGVPVVMLSCRGVSLVYDLCEHNIENVLKPYWPPLAKRLQVMSNLAWCQFTLKEMQSGLMWSEVKQWYGYKSNNGTPP